MKSEIFTSYVDVNFEGHKVMSILNYDQYLSNLYGDYMKFPPIDKRVAHHTFKAYWIKENEKID